MRNRFYVNCPLEPGLAQLDGAEAHHLAAVCRVRHGELVCLFNGDGKEYPATVVEVSRRVVVLRVDACLAPDRELPCRIEVAAPLPKGDRGQFLVEKLTELGVTSYVPLRAERSVVHPSENRRDKLERYVIEASKQCGRNVLMEIRALQPWDAYCQDPTLPPARVLAHPGSGSALAQWPDQSGACALAVGPEGGFTSEEVEQAEKSGWRIAELGPRLLRVETAALVLATWAAMSASGPKGGSEV
jgi:16S rRNA (uracil1498-N3)-methyltransferase